MTEFVFKPGDIVEFEECSSDPGYPRYIGNVDRGGNGKWIKGTFYSYNTMVNLYYFSIDIINKANAYWAVPAPGHIEYSVDQWDRPGFMRLPIIFGETTSNKVRLVDMGGYYATVPANKPIGGDQRTVHINDNLIDWC